MQKIILLLIMVVFGYSQSNNFRKEPYLIYTGVNSVISVNWQLNDSMICQIEWGDDSTYSIGNMQVNQYDYDL